MNDGCNHCRADEGREVAGVLEVEGVGHCTAHTQIHTNTHTHKSML